MKLFKDKKTYFEIVGVFAFLLMVAGYSDLTNSYLTKENTLERNEYGEGDIEVELEVSSADLDKCKYNLVIEEEKITQKKAEKYFKKAIEEIDNSFVREGEQYDCVTKSVQMKEKYVGGKVSCNWTLSDYTIVAPDGIIQENELSKEGNLIHAEAELKCDEYKEQYQFYFKVFPSKKSQKEQLLNEIQDKIGNQMAKKGTTIIKLPNSVNGNKLTWNEKKDYLFIKILFLEVIIIVLLRINMFEKQKNEQKILRKKYILDYPEIVSKLAILVGSGMTIKMAWNRISARYLNDRQKNKTEKRPGYEQMVVTSREIKDGMSERVAFQKCGEKIGISQYSRLSRIILQSISKGNREICGTLEKEAEDAFRDRRVLAKKMGEEAGTKMLAPLLLMMAIVIAIVIAPAIISFKG